MGEILEFLFVPRPGQKAAAFPSGFKGRYLQGFPIELSASQIRERVKAGLPIDLLVGSAVAECIRQNALYLS